MRALKVRGQVTTNRGGVAASSAGSAVSLRRRTRERRVRAHAQTFGDKAAAEGAQQEGLAPAATGADHAATRNTVGATTFPSPFPAIRLSPPVPGQRLPGTRSPHCLANQFFVFFFQITGNRVHAAASSELAISGRERIAVRRTPITPGASLPA